MKQKIDFAEGISRKDLSTVKQRFLALHRERLERINADLAESHRDFLALLPLYLHINHPLLPGFVSSDTPAGLCEFHPEADLLRMAKSHCRGFEYKKRAHHSYPLLGLYVMGSVGSIAYSRRSDLDFWVCHDPDLPVLALERLKSKLEKLERHAAEYGLEVHFYPMNLEQFRRGENEGLSKENSGSTQHILLLEEFYRSAVYIAGRTPLWWYVPPTREGEYQQFGRELLAKRFVEQDEVLDFGGLEQLPAQEFFGSAHWQLYKSISSPYKALLKILLTEAYAKEYPVINWLSYETKRAVYDDEFSADQLDSYLLMYQRVERYLKDSDEPARLELARRCFYFKVDRPLTLTIQRARHQKYRELLLQIVTDWGWGAAILGWLDNRKGWKIDEVLRERDLLVRELSRSYRVLVDFTRSQGEHANINPDELKLLGRKLYAALERRPGKVDSINPGISSDLSEPLLSLHRQQDGPGGWSLFKGEVDQAATAIQTPMRRATTLMELLSWAHLNGILSQGTHLRCYQKTRYPSNNELGRLQQALGQIFPDKSAFRAPIRALHRQPRLRHCALFINPDSNPMAQLEESGQRLTSDRYDPLSFASSRYLLINTIEQVVSTSWGEVLVFQHLGAEGFLDCLVKYLRLSIGEDPMHPAPGVESFCFNEGHGQTIARRVSDVFSFLGHIYGPDGPGPHSRYLLPVGQQHALIHQGPQGYAWRMLRSHDELLLALAEPMSEFSPVVPDPEALGDTPLPAVCAQREPGRLQLFVQQQEGAMNLYIMDEYGSIHCQQVADGDQKYALERIYRFLSSLQLRRGLTSTRSMECLLNDPPRCHQLKRNSNGLWVNSPMLPPSGQLDEQGLELKLLGLDAGQGDPTILVCGEQEFSSVQYGEMLYPEIVHYVLSHRRGRQGYPIYLTGVEPLSLRDEEGWATMRILQQKQRIEGELNRILKGTSPKGANAR